MHVHSRFLSLLPDKEIQDARKRGDVRLRSYARGALVHLEGEVCDKVEVILSGQAVVERIDENGGLLRIAVFEQDALLGGNLLFSCNPHYPMTVTSSVPLQVLEIPRETLFNYLSKHPAFLRHYLQTVSDYTFLLGNKIRHDLHRSIRDSLKNWLRQESSRQQSLTLLLPMSKKELAERLGVQRTSLSRELAKMKQDGLIDFTQTTITITSPAFIGGLPVKEKT